MGPSVRYLNLEALAHSMREFGLQPMVDGVELSNLVERLEHRIVVDSIERKQANVAPIIQVQAGNVGGRASKCIARVAAKLNQRLHKRGIRRISIALPQYVYTHRSNVG